MKVNEVIEILQGADPDSEVTVFEAFVNDGCRMILRSELRDIIVKKEEKDTTIFLGNLNFDGLYVKHVSFSRKDDLSNILPSRR